MRLSALEALQLSNTSGSSAKPAGAVNSFVVMVGERLEAAEGSVSALQEQVNSLGASLTAFVQ